MSGVECAKLLGKGSFGRVFSSTIDGKQYAIKVEAKDAKVPQLKYEYKVLRKLKGLHGVPSAVHSWEQPCGETWMAMQLLGDSFEKRHPPAAELGAIAVAYTRILEGVHSKGFLHRDIKPENMLRGRSGATYWLVDYGLAKKYRRSDGTHIPPRTDKSIVGTPRFVSCNLHAGCQSSRRDDLESLAYSLIYLAKGALPWTTDKADSKQEKVRKIGERKAEISVDRLCAGLPPAFGMYLRAVRELKFEETPQYDILAQYFECQ